MEKKDWNKAFAFSQIRISFYFVLFSFRIKKKSMNLDTAFLSFGISSLVIGITILTIYSSFGPGSKDLIDPFEEDDD